MTVTVTRTGAIGEVIFANPPMNFASVGLLAEIASAMEALDRDTAIRCSILTGTDSIFCAGANLANRDGGGVDGASDDPVAEFYAQGLRLFAIEKPVIAAINGAAIGAGLGLALAADFRVAVDGARLSTNFTRLGYHPGFGLTCTLPRLVGHQKASLMMLTSRRLKAEEALAIGLVDETVPAANLRSAAMKLAAEICDCGPLGIIATRKSLRRGMREEVAASMDRERIEQSILRDTHDYTEGVASVNERRPARFTGS